MVQAGCPVQGRTLFTSLLHSWYHTHFHIYTDGSRLTNPPSVGAAIYIPSRLLATASITTAELFAIKEGLQFATTLAAPCSIALFSDSLSALQIIKSHRPHSHHNFTLIIHHLILHLTSLGHTIHLQWVPSHVSVMGNTMADRAAAEAHTQEPSLRTDVSELLTKSATKGLDPGLDVCTGGGGAIVFSCLQMK
ncbi:hypothetical protein E2C01_064594 [Portunus trituberculatus]|uniref:RNase H type-1 domain-containing protein n=1 Tax=Portunus trituberculatus TaxID=210409 RepID=A0A5B7HDF9_PORTR|nr:hypothetical protein [Portunus trituberculatus]